MVFNVIHFTLLQHCRWLWWMKIHQLTVLWQLTIEWTDMNERIVKMTLEWRWFFMLVALNSALWNLEMSIEICFWFHTWFYPKIVKTLHKNTCVVVFCWSINSNIIRLFVYLHFCSFWCSTDWVWLSILIQQNWCHRTSSFLSILPK